MAFAFAYAFPMPVVCVSVLSLTSYLGKIGAELASSLSFSVELKETFLIAMEEQSPNTRANPSSN